MTNRIDKISVRIRDGRMELIGLSRSARGTRFSAGKRSLELEGLPTEVRKRLISEALDELLTIGARPIDSPPS